MVDPIGRAGRALETIAARLAELVGDAGSGATQLSETGLDFIVEGEMQTGVSNDLHQPTTGSGVTLGAGYDMGGRSAAEVEADLVAVGVALDVAITLSRGAGLTGAAARDFVAQNSGLVDLTRAQEVGLARGQVEVYADAVREAFGAYDLTQNQFDALTSFSYNNGAAVFRANINPQLNAAIQSGDLRQVTDMMERFVFSGGERVEGLVNRRAAEVDLFNRPDGQ